MTQTVGGEGGRGRGEGGIVLLNPPQQWNIKTRKREDGQVLKRCVWGNEREMGNNTKKVRDNFCCEIWRGGVCYGKCRDCL